MINAKILITILTTTHLMNSCHSFAPIDQNPSPDANLSILYNNQDANFRDADFRDANYHYQNQINPNINHHRIKLIGWRWNEVEAYLLIAIFLLLAAIVKIIYHHLEPVHAHIPESCVLIILGSLIGLIFHSTDYGAHLPFNRHHFFLLLLPPIILESSYSLHDREFFFNLKTILLYAIIGTILNICLVGLSLYAISRVGLIGDIPILELLTFSTIVSAVDPVAVLAIFHEIGVNKSLYFLVFGESLLNDAVVITIYNVITTITSVGVVNVTDILMGIASFFSVSLGGVSVGIAFGIITALITKTTKKVQVVEPLVVIVIAYLSYIVSELFHFSGIIGLICCGLVQSEYMTDNIAPHSLVTIKYFTKTCSSISDVIIFFYLGRVLVREDHVWHTGFIAFSTLFCIVYRFLSVFLLTLIANKFMQSIRRINFGEQLLMAYGGLRGAIAFSLAISLDEHNFGNHQLFITTTLFIILFTVFILGSTTKPVIKWLNVKLASDHSDTEEEVKLLFIEITDRTLSTIMSGIEEIADCSSVHTFAQKFSRFNQSILKRLLTHDGDGHSFTRAYKKVRDRIVRRSIDDGTSESADQSAETAIDIEVDPLRRLPYRDANRWSVLPSGVVNGQGLSLTRRRASDQVTDYDETPNDSGTEGVSCNPDKRLRKKVLKKAATLSTTYKHRFAPAQQHPPTITHSMSTVERRIVPDQPAHAHEATDEEVRAWLQSRRRSSHNRRIVSSLFNSSQYYHLPRRDQLVETSVLEVQRVMRQTSRPRGFSISTNRHSRRRTRSRRGSTTQSAAEEDRQPGSPPNTPTSMINSCETHL